MMEGLDEDFNTDLNGNAVEGDVGADHVEFDYNIDYNIDEEFENVFDESESAPRSIES